MPEAMLRHVTVVAAELRKRHGSIMTRRPKVPQGFWT